MVFSRTFKSSTASAPHIVTSDTSQFFTVAPSVNNSNIQTEMSARTEHQYLITFSSHQSSSLAPTTADSQPDHSTVVQLSTMTPRSPGPLVPNTIAPPGTSGTTRHNTDVVMTQDADSQEMVVVSKAADAHKPFKKKKKGPTSEEEEEDCRQLIKDLAKKAPSKKIEDDTTAFSFLTHDNKITRLREFADASSSSADDSTLVDIDVEALSKEMRDMEVERKRGLQSASARRPGSVRGKTTAAIRRTTSSSASLEYSQLQIGKIGNTDSTLNPLNTSFTFSSFMRPQSQFGSNIARNTPNFSFQKPADYPTFASGTSATFDRMGRNPLESPVSDDRTFKFDKKLSSASPSSSQSQLGGNNSRRHWISDQASSPQPPQIFRAVASDSRRPRVDTNITLNPLSMPSAPMAPALYSSYMPPNAPTTQGLVPQRVASLRKQKAEVIPPTGQKTSRRPNREGKNNDSVQRNTHQPSNAAGGIRRWTPVKSRLGGSVITAPAPPQCTTEDVAMSSVSNSSTTTVGRIAPNVSSSASSPIEAQSPAQRPGSSNPPKTASPHHTSGDIAMHYVMTIDNAKEGTSSSVNPAPLPAVLPPAVQTEDKESSSPPATTSTGDSFWDDMYGDEVMFSDDDQTVMGDNESLTQDSTISQKSSGPEGVEVLSESTANLMCTAETNASVSTPIQVVEVKEDTFASSEAEVNNTTHPDHSLVATPPPPAATISNSEVEVKHQIKVSSKNSTSSDQNLESEIPNQISTANDPPPPFDQASSESPVQVVSATPEVMPMKTHVVLSTINVEIAGMGVQETNTSKGQDALPNPLEHFASLATSPDIDVSLAQFREEKARSQGEEDRHAFMSSHVEDDKQKSQRMDVGDPRCSQSPEQVAKPIPMASVAVAIHAEPNLAQSGEESKVFRITKSNGRARQQAVSPLFEEPSSQSIDVEQQTRSEVSDSSKPPLIASSEPPLQEIPPVIQTDDIDMAADERRADSATDSLTLGFNTSPVVLLGDGNHIEIASGSSTNPLASQAVEALKSSPIASSRPPVVEGAPVVQVLPVSNASPLPTTSKASITPEALKPLVKQAVPPSSEEKKADKVSMPVASSKAPPNLTKNVGKAPKPASKTSKDVPSDVPKSSKTKSSKKAKTKGNDWTMGPAAAPEKRPEASNTANKIIPEKDDQPSSPSPNVPILQNPKTESSLNVGNSTKVQGSPPVGEHIKPSKSKEKNKERGKETSKCHPDNTPTKTADSPRSSSTTDSASKKEPLDVVAKTSSPSRYFVPATYSFAKKDKDFVASVPGESIKIDDEGAMQIEVESDLMEVDMDAGGDDYGNHFPNDVEMGECTEHFEQMKVDPVIAPVIPPSHSFGTSHGLSSSTNYIAVPPPSNNKPLYSSAGLSSSQPSIHLANNASSGFSTAWNSYESTFPQLQHASFPQAQQSFVSHNAPVSSMVNDPVPNSLEYVYNIQSPSPCLANNVGVIGFCGPVLYDQGFRPGSPFEPFSNDCARYSEPLERPSLETLLRESCQRKPFWIPFSESIPKYVEPIKPVSYRRSDHLDTPSLGALLRGWKPVETPFCSPFREVVDPVSEPSAETIVTGDIWPVEERVPAWNDTPETHDAGVETTPETLDETHRCSNLERPASNIGAATEATDLCPAKPTATVCKPRPSPYYGPQEVVLRSGRCHPYPIHLRYRTALGKAIAITRKARRKERRRSQLPPVEKPAGAPADLEVGPTLPLEITQTIQPFEMTQRLEMTQPLEATEVGQPLETTGVLQTQPSDTNSSLKATSHPTPKSKAKRRRMPGAWRGPFTPRTVGEERFYRFLSSALEQIRHRVRKAFGEFGRVHKAMNRPSRKHHLRTRISA